MLRIIIFTAVIFKECDLITAASNKLREARDCDALNVRLETLTVASNHDLMGYLTLIVAFVLGGITCPALLAAILLYFIFPQRTESASEPNDILDEGDDDRSIKSTAVLADLGEQFRGEHEPDVAAGYFAVCREYVPGGMSCLWAHISSAYAYAKAGEYVAEASSPRNSS